MLLLRQCWDLFFFLRRNIWEQLICHGVKLIKLQMLFYSIDRIYKGSADEMLVLHAPTQSICPFIALSRIFSHIACRSSPQTFNSCQTFTFCEERVILRQFIMIILIHNVWPWESSDEMRVRLILINWQ